MKRHFKSVLVVTLVVGFGFSTWSCSRATLAAQKKAAATGTNLQLVIEGPFALCPEQKTTNLNIALPNLQGNHYPAGFTADNDEFPLMQKKVPWQYAEYKLELTHDQPAMKLNGDGAGQEGNPTGPATMYREKGPCTITQSDGNSRGASLLISVPKPDEIWPLAHGGELTTAFDGVKSGVGTKPFHGPCQHNKDDCRHANALMLRYLNVDLTKVKVTCVTGDCAPYPNRANSWPSPNAFLPIGEARLVLDLHPVVVNDDDSANFTPSDLIPSECQNIRASSFSTGEGEKAMQEEETEAFCTLTQMVVNAPRYLLSSHNMVGAKQPSAKRRKSKKKVHIFLQTQHRDCSVPPALICQSDTCP